MRPYKLSKAGISVSQGVERFNGSKEMYEQVLKNFVNDTHYAELCAAIEKQNVEAAFAAAHALKGVAGNLSMVRLFEDILPLVEVLRGGSLDNVTTLLEPVSQDYQEIIAVLS